MASRGQIEFDFANAKRQADELEELAGGLNSISQQQFSGTLQNISSCWKGENANLYLRKGYILVNEISSTSRELLGIAAVIRTTAQKIYNAEMEALRIAERRNKGGGGRFR